MLLAKMTISSILVLARFFNFLMTERFIRRAVILTALLMCLFFYPSSALASPSVLVAGPPEWLSIAAERAVNAVWIELDQQNISKKKALETLALVGRRLFSGYSVTVDPDEPVLYLIPDQVSAWSVSIRYPELSSPMYNWLRDDMVPVREGVMAALEGVSPSALGWADRDFREYLSLLMTRYVPGWRSSMMVRVGHEKATLEISITPESPLILITNPAIYSATLPNFLRDSLRKSLLKDLSPIAGLPVSWIELHIAKVESWTEELLNDRNTVSNSLSNVKVSIDPGLISKVDARVESSRYSFRVWLAAYSGVNDRPPEFGLHVGRNVQILSGWESELYAEFLLDLDDFDLEDRWGLRWNVKGPVYIGAEYSFPESILWYRLWLEGNNVGPYLWIRYSERDESVFSVGYRINQRISIELNYDDRYDDRLSIKAVGDL